MAESCENSGEETLWVEVGGNMFSSLNPEGARVYAILMLTMYSHSFECQNEAYFALLTIAYRLKDILGPGLTRELFRERLMELQKRIATAQAGLLRREPLY